MTLDQFGIISGVVLGTIGAAAGILAFYQHGQALKKADNERHNRDLHEAELRGARNQRDDEMQQQIDNAHRKIREEIMPKLSEMDRTHTEIYTTFEYIKTNMEETKSILRDMSSNIIELGKQVAGIQGERRGSRET
jgi:gas vesicle protein